MLEEQVHQKAVDNQTPGATRRFALSAPGSKPTRTSKKTSSLATRGMDGKYQIIRTPDALRQACEHLLQSEAHGLDCETTDLNPHSGRIRLIQLSTPSATYVIDYDRFNRDDFQPLKPLLESPKPRTICHNGKFDQKWIKHFLGIEIAGLFDSQLASQLIHYSPGQHNLEAVSRKYLDVALDKSLQRSNWEGELSEDQITYAARDSQVLVPLREAMIPRLTELGLIKAAQLEFEAVVALSDIELAGIFLDRELWQQQVNNVSRQHEIIARELQEMLAEGAMQTTLFGHSDINLGSHTQIADALRQMGLPINGATNNTVLLPLKDQFPVVAKLLEYRALDKSLTSYGQAWIDQIHPQSNRIFPDFNQIGAPTGRMSCADPNVQQVPTEKEYRQCFRAPEGRKLLICDYSQIELRILAELSHDRGFVDAFRSGADLHRTTAASVFNVSLDNVSKEQRDFAKRLNFGVVYGIGAARFSFMTGMPLNEAEATLRRYFQTYRQLDEYLREAGQHAVDNHSTRTLSGRLVQYRFDPADREQVSGVRRRGRNAPIQGTSADIIKRSLALLHHELKGTSARIVNVIHDEIVVEVDPDDAEEIGHRVSAKMVQAATEYVKTIPILAEPSIADEWVK